MIIVDNRLREREKEANPIKVGIIGAGAMGVGIVNQIARFTPGMRVAAVFNRHIEKALAACQTAGITKIQPVKEPAEADRAIAGGATVIADDIDMLIASENVDILVEATGSIGFAASAALNAIKAKKDFLSFNAELDASFGPLLKHYADRQGAIYSGSDGDQPGVIMNLYRFVKSMGLRPLVCGNIKGLQDPYRTPATQAEFARKFKISPEMATSFADGSKISFEQACVANAARMRVAKRGMNGFHSTQHIDELTDRYDAGELEEMGGIVDYFVGPTPKPGVFVYASSSDPLSKHHLNYYKLGKGPLYSFYTPYHLCIFEVPNSIARVVDFRDAPVAPAGGPVVEVISIAKTDLAPGEKLDGIGGFKTYGQCENTGTAIAENLLPLALAEGCRVKRTVKKDEPLTFDDVEYDKGALVFQLFDEQRKLFNL